MSIASVFASIARKRIEQILAVQRLAAQLIGHGLDDFGIAMTDVEDAEAAQAIDVRAPGDVAIGVRSGVGPLDDGAGVACVGRFAVFEKARIDVVAKRLDGFARDPRRFVRRDLASFRSALRRAACTRRPCARDHRQFSITS